MVRRRAFNPEAMTTDELADAVRFAAARLATNPNLVAALNKAAEVLEEGLLDVTGSAVLLGTLGGKKGGKARAAKLSPERRSEIARMAARARWKSRGQ